MLWDGLFQFNQPPLTGVLMRASSELQAMGIPVTAPNLSRLFRADRLPRQHLAADFTPNCRQKIWHPSVEDPQNRLFRIPHPCDHSGMLLSGYNHEGRG